MKNILIAFVTIFITITLTSCHRKSGHLTEQPIHTKSYSLDTVGIGRFKILEGSIQFGRNIDSVPSIYFTITKRDSLVSFYYEYDNFELSLSQFSLMENIARRYWRVNGGKPEDFIVRGNEERGAFLLFITTLDRPHAVAENYLQDVAAAIKGSYLILGWRAS